VRIKNEDTELQTILENNLDLIPGEQITPDGEPRSWILVKREMPVPDPTSGGNRWSIDFFLADQDAIPTFVECKRHDDARARREIVGQMLDYVANGTYYWSAGEIKEYAVQSASKRGKSIESILSSLGPKLADDVDGYFDAIEENLRQGKVRMVFLLEDSSYELRSIVDFLNGQMDRAEVLLVEVRQYQIEDKRIVVPTLFGFTEKARMDKRETNFSSSDGRRRTWDLESFIEDAITKVTTEQLEAFKRVVSASKERSWDIKWGTGKETGSLSIRISGMTKRSILTIWSNGSLTMNFGWLTENKVEEQVRDSMAMFAKDSLKINLPDDYKNRYVTIQPSVWVPKVEDLISYLGAQQIG